MGNKLIHRRLIPTQQVRKQTYRQIDWQFAEDLYNLVDVCKKLNSGDVMNLEIRHKASIVEQKLNDMYKTLETKEGINF